MSKIQIKNFSTKLKNLFSKKFAKKPAPDIAPEEIQTNIPPHLQFINWLKKQSGFNTFDFEHFFHHIYSPEFRPKVHRFFSLIFIGLLTYTMGKTVALWLRPVKKIVSIHHT